MPHCADGRKVRDVKNVRGFTLLEVMLAAVILAGAILGIFAAFTTAARLSADSREQNIAMFDMKTICDHIAGLPFDDIMDPNYPPGVPEAPAYPHGGIINMTHLPNERVQVFYYDTNGTMLSLPVDPNDAWATHTLGANFDTPDPLRYHITVTWTDYKGDTRSEELWSMRTR